MALGVTLSPAEGFSPPRVLELTKLAEDLGFRSVYYPESNQADAVGLMHAAAVATSKIRLATAVIPIQTRTPALVAMGYSVLSHLAPGRIWLGVGHSSPNVVRRWHGRPFDPDRPTAQVEEFVAAFRACLEQERVVFDGEWFSIDGFRLRLRPDPRCGEIPVIVGVLGDRALEKARRFAQGAVMSYIMPERLGRLAASGGNESGPDFEIVVSLNAAVVKSTAAANEVASGFRRQIVNYAIVDAYANAFGMAGYGDAIAKVRELWDSGDRTGALEAVPIEMCFGLAAIGSASEIAGRIRSYLDAGAREVALSIFESTVTAKAEAALEAISKEISK